jgi:hypothetical protein
MNRFVLVYGILAGAISILLILTGFVFGADSGAGSVWLGYLIMLAASSLIFAGIKRYRDIELGGVIRFWKAAGMGLCIALVSGIVYAIGWEIYLWLTDYSFFPEYTKATIEAKRSAGASSAEIDKLTREMAELGEHYTQPLYRLVMTLAEILPVGVIVSFISAAFLRRHGFMPYRGRV